MSTPAANASKSRANPLAKVILLDDEEESILRPTPLTDEDALKMPSHDNEVEEKEETLAVGNDEDSDEDDDVEEYLEDILHTLLETEGATEQDGTIPDTSDQLW